MASGGGCDDVLGVIVELGPILLLTGACAELAIGPDDQRV